MKTIARCFFSSLTAPVFALVAFVLLFLVGAFMPHQAHAAGQAEPAASCGPGRDCVSRSFQPQSRARARFPACTAARVGQIAFDGDAGVLAWCARDGGWSELGGGGGDSFWQLTAADRLAPTIGVPYTIDGNNGQTGLTFTDDNLVSLFAGDTGLELHSTSFGGDYFSQVVLSTSQVATTVTNLATGGNQSFGLYDGAGLVLNGTTAITGWPQNSYYYDGGTTLAGGIRYVQTVSFTGALKWAQCAVADTGQPDELQTWCRVTADDTVKLFFKNVGEATITPCRTPGTCVLKVRLVNP